MKEFETRSVTIEKRAGRIVTTIGLISAAFWVFNLAWFISVGIALHTSETLHVDGPDFFPILRATFIVLGMMLWFLFLILHGILSGALIFRIKPEGGDQMR